MTTAAAVTDPRRQATEKWHQSVRMEEKVNERNKKGRLYIPRPAYLGWKGTQIFKCMLVSMLCAASAPTTKHSFYARHLAFLPL